MAWGYPNDDHRLALFDVGRSAIKRGLIDASEVGEVGPLVVGQHLFTALDHVLGQATADASAVVLPPLLDHTLRVLANRHPTNHWRYCHQRLGRFVAVGGRERPAVLEEYRRATQTASRPGTPIDTFIWPDPAMPAAGSAVRFTFESPALPGVGSARYERQPAAKALRVVLQHWAPQLARRSSISTRLALLHLEAAIPAVLVWATASRGMALPMAVHDAWQFFMTRAAFYGPWCARLFGEPVQYSSIEHADQMLYAETQELFLSNGVTLHPEVWQRESAPGFEVSPFLPPARRRAVLEAMFLPHPAVTSAGQRSDPTVVRIPSADVPPLLGVASLPEMPSGTPLSLLRTVPDRSTVALVAVTLDHYALHDHLGEPPLSEFEGRLREATARVRQSVIDFSFEIVDDGVAAEAFVPAEDFGVSTMLAVAHDGLGGHEGGRLVHALEQRLSHLGSVGIAWRPPSAHGRSAADEALQGASIASYARREVARYQAALDTLQAELAAVELDLRGIDDAPAGGLLRNARHRLHRVFMTLGIHASVHPSIELQAASGVRNFGPLSALASAWDVYAGLPIVEIGVSTDYDHHFLALGRFTAAAVEAQRASAVPDPVAASAAAVGEWLRSEHEAPAYRPALWLRA